MSKLYLNNMLYNKKMILCWNSWRSYTRHADSYNFRFKMYNSIKYIEY